MLEGGEIMTELKITNHDGKYKMAGFRSLNVSVLQNRTCSMFREINISVCKHCYARKMELRMSSFKKNLEHNTEILTKNMLKTKDVPIINDRYFRFNSIGELYNNTHLKNLYKICRVNYRTNFTLWTKLTDGILFHRKPANLMIVHSCLTMNSYPNLFLLKKYDRLYHVWDKVSAKVFNIDINCLGRCIDCLKCYNPKDETRIINCVKR